MSTTLNIPVILGTARNGRVSEAAARFVSEETAKAGHDTVLVDPRDYALSVTDNSEKSEKAKAYIAIVRAADALIIVTPEYNHGYPGELKLLLDLTYKPYFDKPVAICGVSNGPWGGTRCVEQLREVVVALGMYPVQRAVYFPRADVLFSGGTIAEAERTRYEKSVAGVLDQLAGYARALKVMR